MSEYLKKDIKQLFDENIVSFVPFIQDDDFSKFDVELGLKKPCIFFKDNKCTIYDARPMNCRTFPYWMINHSIEDENTPCIKGVKPDVITNTLYNEYERIIGLTLIEQSEITDRFMKKINAVQRIDISNNKVYLEVNEKLSDKLDPKLISKIMDEASKMIDKKIYESIPLIIKKINETNYNEILDDLISAEELLEGDVNDEFNFM